MKKLLLAALSATAISLFTIDTQAQAWEKSSKVLSLGAGASSFFHIYPSNNVYYGYYGKFRAPLTGQFNFQGEFGVHDYVGIGFTTGIGGRGPYYWGTKGGSGNTGEINVPIGVIANFHFYRLIDDKVSSDIHSDKLDIYGGINLGSGIAAQFFNEGTSQVIPIAFGGVQLGARYYFTPKFGVNLEVGYGKSIVNGGVVFKL